jgi:predicted nucleic acid-binding protein
MNVYLDTSVVLRRLLRQPNALPDWGTWEEAYASVLLRVEALRTIDRLRLEGCLDDTQRVELQQQLNTLCDNLYLVSLTPEVLERASQPLPTILGTLDALHLATADLLRRQGTELTVLTHDDRLALAARSVGLPTRGV